MLWEADLPGEEPHLLTNKHTVVWRRMGKVGVRMTDSVWITIGIEVRVMVWIKAKQWWE